MKQFKVFKNDRIAVCELNQENLEALIERETQEIDGVIFPDGRMFFSRWGMGSHDTILMAAISTEYPSLKKALIDKTPFMEESFREFEEDGIANLVIGHNFYSENNIVYISSVFAMAHGEITPEQRKVIDTLYENGILGFGQYLSLTEGIVIPYEEVV